MLTDSILLLALSIPAAPATEPAPVATFDQDPRQPIEPALALPYTYIGVAYLSANVDGYSDDPDGLTIDASVSLNDMWFAFGSRDALSGKVAGNDVDVNTWHAGLGLRTSVATNVDLVLGAGMAFLDADSSAPGAGSDEALELRAGIRAALGERGELGAGAIYTDWNDNDSVTTVYLQGAYYLEKRIGFTAGFSSSDDVDAFAIGVRFVP